MDTSVRAPDLDGDFAWLNIDAPLSLRALRGSVVVLDFWTYCCINCMHVIATLREIEARHRDDALVVIGVHSGKFTAEQGPRRVQDAIDRYGVEHPVVADEDMVLWSRFAIRSWPTLVVVRPDGTIAAVAPGEPDLEVLDAFITRELDSARAAGTLVEKARPPVTRGAREHSPLRYPGKAATLPDGRVVVSDSGHHRLLVCRPDGEAELVVVSGLPGLRDGALAEAHPGRPRAADRQPAPTPRRRRDGRPHGGGMVHEPARARRRSWARRRPRSTGAGALRRRDGGDRARVARPRLARGLAPLRPGPPPEARAPRRGGGREIARGHHRRGGDLSLRAGRRRARRRHDYVACAKGDAAACFPRRVHLRVPVRVLPDGVAHVLDFRVPLSPAS